MQESRKRTKKSINSKLTQNLPIHKKLRYFVPNLACLVLGKLHLVPKWRGSLGFQSLPNPPLIGVVSRGGDGLYSMCLGTELGSRVFFSNFLLKRFVKLFIGNI